MLTAKRIRDKRTGRQAARGTVWTSSNLFFHSDGERVRIPLVARLCKVCSVERYRGLDNGGGYRALGSGYSSFRRGESSSGFSRRCTWSDPHGRWCRAGPFSAPSHFRRGRLTASTVTLTVCLRTLTRHSPMLDLRIRSTSASASLRVLFTITANSSPPQRATRGPRGWNCSE